MSFQILDYLEELEKYGKVIRKSTWIQATCPICEGKLKISTNPSKYGAYACYTNECHQNDKIRNLLYKKHPFCKSSAFKYKILKPPKLLTIIKPITVQAEPSDFLTDVPFNKPTQLREGNQIRTYFNYDTFRIVRVDTRDKEGKHKKYIYPEYYFEGKYVRGLPHNTDFLPIYTSSYIQSCMVFVEGEKAATIGQKLGLATATFPTFAYSEKCLDKYASQLYTKGLTNVLYLADNDEAGHHKAELVSNSFWAKNIGTKVVNLVEVYPEYKEVSGFDLYDAYKHKLIKPENVTKELDNILSV